jgi:hypothetical protein
MEAREAEIRAIRLAKAEREAAQAAAAADEREAARALAFEREALAAAEREAAKAAAAAVIESARAAAAAERAAAEREAAAEARRAATPCCVDHPGHEVGPGAMAQSSGTMISEEQKKQAALSTAEASPHHRCADDHSHHCHADSHGHSHSDCCPSGDDSRCDPPSTKSFMSQFQGGTEVQHERQHLSLAERLDLQNQQRQQHQQQQQ